MRSKILLTTLISALVLSTAAMPGIASAETMDEEVATDVSLETSAVSVSAVQVKLLSERLCFEGYNTQTFEDEDGNFYTYYYPLGFQQGDALILTLSNGTSAEYEFDGESFVNRENEKDTISPEDVSPYDWCGEETGKNHWTPGNTYQVRFSYKGLLSSNTVPVKILTTAQTNDYVKKITNLINNLPEETEFSLNDTETIQALKEIEYAEWTGLLDERDINTDKYYELLSAYSQLLEIPDLPEIKVGEEKSVSISYDKDIYENAWRFCPETNGNIVLTRSDMSGNIVVTEDNKFIASTDEESNTMYFTVAAGHTYVIHCYHEKDKGNYTIQLTKNPIESIRLEPVKTYELENERDGNWDYVYDDDGNETDEKYFYYYFPVLENGTKLIVTKDGKNITYVFDEDKYRFVNAVNKNDVISEDDWYYESDQYFNHWKVGNTYSWALKYKGVETSVPVKIVAKKVSIEDATVTGLQNKVFTGNAITQKPTVKVNGTTLKEGTDYSISYEDNVNPGTAYMLIRGKDKYPGLAVEEFRILFKDMTSNKEFNDAIFWALDNEITTGYKKNGKPDGTFRPWNSINRAAVVTFLWRANGCPQPKSIATFKDMPANTQENQDFRKAISWAAENGITTGYGDNTFRPWDKCNRAAIVTFIWRSEGRPTPAKTASFKDMTSNSDFNKAISWGGIRRNHHRLERG